VLVSVQNADILTLQQMQEVIKSGIGIKDCLQSIYHRSCDLAVENSHDLLHAINDDVGLHQNSAIKAAVEQHQIDMIQFQRGEVSATVPKKSNDKLYECIQQVEPNPESGIHEKAKKSSHVWDLVCTIGVALVTVCTLVGFVLLKL
jgi:hypothetical protein